jgi:hypothetical protein
VISTSGLPGDVCHSELVRDRLVLASQVVTGQKGLPSKHPEVTEVARVASAVKDWRYVGMATAVVRQEK